MAGKTGAGTAEAEMTGAMRAGAETKGKGPGMEVGEQVLELRDTM